jgi:hypothetical protein
MSCAEIIPKLELMADDELSSEQAAQVLSHIDDCAACRDNWYGIIALRQAIKDRAASFVPPSDFEERVINSIRKEAWQPRDLRGKRSWLYAAAALAIGGTVSYMYISHQGQNSHAPSGGAMVANESNSTEVMIAPPVASQSPSQGASQQISHGAQLASASNTAASLEDAVSNFEQLLKTATLPGSGATTEKDMNILSGKAGFTVKPMQLDGFKLAGASLVAAGPGKASMVRLCYRRKTGHGLDSIVCYQTATGHLRAKGLAEHLIDGKKICCGEVEDKSVVFIPGQKGNANETLLVGNISKSDLMDLVLSSS